MIDRTKFFAAIRASLFNGRMKQAQVAGIESILDEYERRNLTDVRPLAHILGTVLRETGSRFQPITESLDYSVSALKQKFPSRISAADADKYGRKPNQVADQIEIGNRIYGGEWGAKQLGNTQSGDGWKFRGRNLPQITGRGNYSKFSNLIFGDQRLVTNPDLANDPAIGTTILFEGLYQGLFTGKSILNYFPPKGTGTADWVNARRALNGLDHAEEIAENAIKFNAALQGSIVVGSPPSTIDPPFGLPPDVEPPQPIVSPTPVRPDPGLSDGELNDMADRSWIVRLLAALVGLFRRKR